MSDDHGHGGHGGGDDAGAAAVLGAHPGHSHGSGGHGGGSDHKPGSHQASASTPSDSRLIDNGTLSKEQLLVMFGFVKGDDGKAEWEKIKGKSELTRRMHVLKLGRTKCRKLALVEMTEIADQQFDVSGYPGNGVRYHLILESATENVEETYYDILERCRQAFGFPFVYKVTDYFAASENSAFFGNSQQRLGLQQDRVQQFLANIGKFVKELFQMVREMRILDERLQTYNSAGGVGSKYCTIGENGGYTFAEHKTSHAADVSLKSVFTDLVEGGTKNPQSVFGLAQQVGFTLLPDLFFNEYVRSPDDIDARIDKLEYNKSIKSVLKRKLYQYLTWKEKTYTELVTRRNFNLKYLRQHWTIIKMYISWIKPYLRNIQRLTMNPDLQNSAELISAFEASTIEVEFIAHRAPSSGYHPIVLASFNFRTRPDMTARKEYQTGPVHLGRMDMSLRAYAWTPEQLQAYKMLKQREEIELLGLLDSQLKDIMDSLGIEFEEYLREAGEVFAEEEANNGPKEKSEGAAEPFIALFGGIKEIVEAFVPAGLFQSGHDDDHSHDDPGGALKDAQFGAWQTYHTYKKSRRMITW